MNVTKVKLSAVLLASVMILLSGCSSKGNAEVEAAAAGNEAGKLKKLVIAEPLHYTGYLPLYVAQREGYFADEGLEVEMLQAAGGTHVTSVVSGDAWGVIGGPESNALANIGNSDPIVSVSNVVNRANVYLMAKKGTAPAGSSDEELKAFLQDKKLNAGRHGGTPNLLTQYLLLELGLDPQKDVRLLEPADGSTVVAMVQQGAADIANGAEPQISDGIAKGVWEEPFYKFHDMGDYAYSVLSVKKSTLEKDPETVQKAVNAVVKALKAIQEDKALAMSVLKAEFPTLSDEAAQAALDRAYADRLWSPDGIISEEALDKDMNVMIKTGIYKGEYTYEDLVDMQFVNKTAVK
ncbi:nitrate ABC transporter substrate-binding protein [Paenibacillus sp. FSL P4-0081]|uniref:ABC transporter substrate-binding protein n=1 Tax=Paenibacillus sp. FSL P4-0081 TaxID=1536769 RepID=UPI0004F5C0E3|nr:ABC transporter substrate-binding protein [Paenibacillus sp. FSL P4-0081]AIQ27692.1 nitrate ABC transporter substrate-binding protein [Paenibacillus sp. FSL P4-0081]